MDNAGGTGGNGGGGMDKASFGGAGDKGGAGCAGCAGWPVRNEGRRGGEPGRIALGSQGIILGRRLDDDEEDCTSRLLAVAGDVASKGAGLTEDEEEDE